MSIALREENFVVISVGSTITVAGIGMHDTNKPPTVAVNMADYNYPIKYNQIVDWKELENCWHHILFKELNIKKSRNECPVLLAVPMQWTKLEYERITQIFFENFNVPGIYIAPQPLLTLFGCGAVSGIVVDIGSEVTDVNVIIDSNVQSQSSFTIPIGGNDFDTYFLELLQKDTNLVQQISSLSDVELNLDFAKYVRELPGICNVAVDQDTKVKSSTDAVAGNDITSSMSELPLEATEEIIEEDDNNPKKVDEEDVGDIPETVEIKYKGHKLNIGSYRHRVLDPLFAPELIFTGNNKEKDSLLSSNQFTTSSLTEVLKLATMNCEPPEIRPKLWENITIAGGCCRTAGLAKRVKLEAQLFLPQSENAGDTQPRQINFLRIPDYFTVLKNKQYQQYSTWLGGAIVAKLIFIDAKNYISKVDYNEHGPTIVHTKSL